MKKTDDRRQTIVFELLGDNVARRRTTRRRYRAA
jgi:hypothetical protein